MVVGLLDGIEDRWIMDFTSGEFVPARVPGGMEVGNVLDIGREIVNEMPFADLLMVDVKDNLHVLTLNCVGDLKRFIASNEIITGVIDEFVEWLNDERDARSLQQACCVSEAGDEAIML